MDDSPSLSIHDLAVSARRFPDRGALVSLEVGEDNETTVTMSAYDATQLAARLVNAAWEAIPPDPLTVALSAAEFRQLATLLRRYAESEMDQWGTFSLTTTHGPVHLTLTRSGGGADDDLFGSLDGYLTEPNGPDLPAE